jgi:hypothetical protein
MVLLLDAGHQMKKRQSYYLCFDYLLVVESLWFTAWEWKTLSKENTVLLKQKEVVLLQFVDKMVSVLLL